MLNSTGGVWHFDIKLPDYFIWNKETTDSDCDKMDAKIFLSKFVINFLAWKLLHRTRISLTYSHVFN